MFSQKHVKGWSSKPFTEPLPYHGFKSHSLILSLTQINNPAPCLLWVCSVYLKAPPCKQGSVYWDSTMGMISSSSSETLPRCWCKTTINIWTYKKKDSRAEPHIARLGRKQWRCNANTTKAAEKESQGHSYITTHQWHWVFKETGGQIWAKQKLRRLHNVSVFNAICYCDHIMTWFLKLYIEFSCVNKALQSRFSPRMSPEILDNV